MEIAAWIKTNASPTVRVATDFPQAFEWQNDRYYYDTYPIAYAEQMGMPSDEAIASLARQYNITLFMVNVHYASVHGFTKDPDLTLVKQFPDYRIYLYHCLNCTQTPPISIYT